MKRFVLIGALAILFPLPSLAEEGLTNDMVRDLNIGGIMDPETGEMMEYSPPVEPNYPAVKYLKQDPATSLRERVDRLLHGIKIDLPPEYDHYGYELRRYMAHVGNPEIYTSPARLKEELGNISKAKIVHKFWRQELLKEISAIEKEIEEKNSSADVKTSLKYNSGVVMAFMGECGSWIENNEKMLKLLEKSEGLYTFTEGKFRFSDNKARQEFGNLYIKTHQSRKYINEYLPFGAMVY